MKRWALLFLMLLITSNSNFLLAQQYDPMAPPEYRSVKKDTTQKAKKKSQYYYNLRQIVIAEQGNRAVINGYVLKEGDHINKAQVVKIEENKVTLSKDGKLSVIKLSYPIKKVRQ